MVSAQEKEDTSRLMAVIMKGTLWIMKQMDMENFKELMDSNMKVNGSAMSQMGWEKQCTLMEINTVASF